MRTGLMTCMRMGLPSGRRGLALALVAGAMLVAPAVVLAAAIVGSASNVAGISGLTVGAATYDVSFSTNSYNNTFSSADPTFFGNATDANAAASAIAALFQTDGVTGIGGGDCSTRPLGITDFLHCIVFVATTDEVGAWTDRVLFPNGSNTGWFVNSIGTLRFGANDAQGLVVGNPNYQTGGGGYQYFAVFTAQTNSSVPEPSSLALVGLALAGLGLGRASKSHARS